MLVVGGDVSHSAGDSRTTRGRVPDNCRRGAALRVAAAQPLSLSRRCRAAVSKQSAAKRCLYYSCRGSTAVDTWSAAVCVRIFVQSPPCRCFHTVFRRVPLFPLLSVCRPRLAAPPITIVTVLLLTPRHSADYYYCYRPAAAIEPSRRVLLLVYCRLVAAIVSAYCRAARTEYHSDVSPIDMAQFI